MLSSVSLSHVRRTAPTRAVAVRVVGLAGAAAGVAAADEWRPRPVSYSARSQNWYVVPLTRPICVWSFVSAESPTSIHVSNAAATLLTPTVPWTS